MTDIQKARDFAEVAHKGQTRKSAGSEPYFIHLEEVAAHVTRFGGSEVAIMAAWLHDTVEDCGVTRTEIAATFGETVAAVVAELTDDKSLPKPERKRMQLVNAPKKSADAALVKLCDKMSNVRAVGMNPPVHWPQERKLAYVDWAESVVQGLPSVSSAATDAFAEAVQATRAALSS